jgi:hypothetical protein
VISDIASGNSSPTYYDFDSFEEIQITTGRRRRVAAGRRRAGELHHPSGSNSFTGYGRFYNTNDKCFGKLGGCQAIQRHPTDYAQAGRIARGIRFRTSATGARSWVVRIKKNKAWFWGATFAPGRARRRARLPTTSRRSGLPGHAACRAEQRRTARSRLESIHQRLPVSAILTTLKNNNRAAAVSGCDRSPDLRSPYTYGDKVPRVARPAIQFHPLITARLQTGPATTSTPSITGGSSTTDLTITGQYTHITEDWFLGFQNDGLKDVQAINWVDTTYWDRSKSSGSYHTIRPQDDARADGNYFASNKLGADHSIKFGFAFRRSPVESLSTVGGGAVARLPRPVSVRGRPVDYDADRSDRQARVHGPGRDLRRQHGDGLRRGQHSARLGLHLHAVSAKRLHQRLDQKRPRHGQHRPALRSAARPRDAGTVPANRILPAQLPAINFPGRRLRAPFYDWSPRADSPTT